MVDKQIMAVDINPNRGARRGRVGGSTMAVEDSSFATQMADRNKLPQHSVDASMKFATASVTPMPVIFDNNADARSRRRKYRKAASRGGKRNEAMTLNEYQMMAATADNFTFREAGELKENKA
jgi:hypothetical protein